MKLPVQISPSAERLIIKREKEAEKTKGGILLPDNAKRKTMKATVIAVGIPGVTTTGSRMPAMPWKVGDKIFVSIYAGHELEIDDRDYGHEDKFVVICRDDVLATEWKEEDSE